MNENNKTDNTKSKPKTLNLEFDEVIVRTGVELIGNISLNYEGRFDSISINSQIEDTSDVFTYTEIEGRKKNHPYARLSIMKKELKDPTNFQFKVITKHLPKGEFTSVKFRATLIQEHKEIASDVKFIKIKK